MAQPVLTSDKGVILTIGMRVNDNRVALVFPCATDSQTVDRTTLCGKAVAAATEALVPLLQPMMDISAWISYISGEAMDDGSYPWRLDFASTEYPGSVDESEPYAAQVGGLVCFYAETLDIAPGTGLGFSRMTVPGLCESQVASGLTSSAYNTLLNSLATAMVSGFSQAAALSPKYYRVLAKPPHPHTPGANLTRIGAWTTRRYLGTQRRRITPH